MVRLILVLALVPLLFTQQLVAQSAESVLKKTSEHYKKEMGKIDDMKMVLRPEGDMAAFDRMITYYKKVEENGAPMFLSHTQFEGGMGEMMGPASSSRPMDWFAMGTRLYDELKDVASYKGTEKVDGFKTHVLFVEEMTDILNEVNGEEDGMTKITDVDMYIDAEKWVIRRMTMYADVEEQGMARKMKMDMTMSDYRQVGPAYYPYMVKTVIENPLTAEQRAEMEAQRAQMEEMMKQIPEGQREQVKKMLGALGGDEIIFAMAVEDFRVNEGVPAEYFD